MTGNPNLAAVTVGQNLEIQGQLSLGQAAGASGLDVVLMSGSPSLKLSPDGLVAGTNSITVHIPAGGISGSYFLIGAANSGSANYTAAASGFNTGNGTILLAPSSVVIFNPVTGFDPTMWSNPVGPVPSPLTPAAPISLFTAVVDSAGNVSEQSVAAGLSLSVTVISDTPSAGAVTSPVTIGAGNNTGATLFSVPSGVNPTTVTISVTQPSGFTAPVPNRYTSLAIEVQ